MVDQVKVLNIKVLSIHLQDVLATLDKGVVFTPNVDHLMKLQKDRAFYDCYQQADWLICDSEIINLASKFLGTPIKEVIPGSSFFPAYYEYHKDNPDIKIFLLGAAEGVAAKAQAIINKKIGREIIVGSYSPKYGFEKDEAYCNEINDIINNSGANILVVGLGAPKQEKWIIKNKGKHPNIDLYFALGATIDFEAGHIKRAPEFFRRIYAEWCYRLLKEPKRLWKRYLVDDIPFFIYIIKQKLNLYRNPFEDQ